MKILIFVTTFTLLNVAYSSATVYNFNNDSILALKLNPKAVSLDLRNYGIISPVKNQSNCGSCWAFGTISAIESQSKLYFKKDFDLSEQQMLDCGNAGDCSGGSISKLLNSLYIEKIICEKETNYPYKTMKSDCINIPTNASLKIYLLAFDTLNNLTTQEIKNEICRNGEVISTVYIGPENLQMWRDCKGEDNCLSNALDKKQRNSKTITIIGWDDNKKAWLIKNTWGKEWGNEGFAWVAYNSFNIGQNVYTIKIDNVK
jgi:C1A family cysteine protease